MKHECVEGCSYGHERFLHYLCLAAPEVEWFKVKDVGSYSGSVYAIGRYKKKILIYRGYYGSCSGCGAWGEGGEPKNVLDVLNSDSMLCKNIDEALLEFMKVIGDSYDRPDEDEYEGFIKAIKEAGRG